MKLTGLICYIYLISYGGIIHTREFLGHLWEHHTDVLSDPFVYDLTRLVITRRRYSYPVAVHNIRNHRLYLSLHLWSDRWNELLLVKQP